MQKEKEARVLTMFNNKGGVGKSTTTFMLSKLLAKKDKKVLIIDCDIQGNLSFSMNEDNRYVDDSITELLTTNNDIRSIIKKTSFENIDLIRSSYSMIDVNEKLIKMEDGVIENIFDVPINLILKTRIELVKYEYDFIMIDLAPNIDRIVKNGLACADSIIIPIDSSEYSSQGINLLLKVINDIKQKHNRKLNIGGIFINFFKKDKTNIDVYNDLHTHLGSVALKTVIYDRKIIEKNTDTLVDSFKQNNKQSRFIEEQYNNLLNEVMKNV